MHNFLIGQFGVYDTAKFNKDYREGFYGVEACLMKTERDIIELKNQIDKKDMKIGIHFPLRAGIYPNRDPLFLDDNSERRSMAYKSVEEELKYLKDRNISPEHIIFHYPKPAIIKDDFDFGRWRFSDSSEYAFEAEYGMEKLVSYSRTLFQWLSEKSEEYNFIPVLEFDTLNKYIVRTGFLEELLEEYSSIKLCMDIGRIHIQDSIDADFDGTDILRRFSRYAYEVHLWDAKVGETVVECSHYPILPIHKVHDGWADIEAYLGVIRAENNAARLLFEHRSDVVSDEELDSCYNWINSLYNI